MINEEIKGYIDKSVLCWFATSDKNHVPNVSPKRLFTHQDDYTLLIANISSDNTVSNIKDNPWVCISFVDVFVQKGYKLKGRAKIVTRENPVFEVKLKILIEALIFNPAEIPVKSVIEVLITRSEEIIEPEYYLFPDVTEGDQVIKAMKMYNVRPN